MPNRRDVAKGLIAAAVAAACAPALARRGRGSVSLTITPRPLGLNLSSDDYFDTQIPFLNVFKQSSTNANDGLGAVWTTIDSGDAETNEEQYLQLDANGYVTSLTASPVPSGGQKFTRVGAATLVGVALGNGATYVYPPDTYVFMWQGKGTFVFYGGDITSLASASAGCTIGTSSDGHPQVTSSNAWGTTNSVTLQGSGAGGALAPANGIRFRQDSIPDLANYPKAIAIVPSTYISNYNGGQVFHPLFLSWLSKWPLASLRFMKPQSTENEVVGGPYGWTFPCLFAANPASGNNSATFAETIDVGDYGSGAIAWSSGIVTVAPTGGLQASPVGSTFTTTISGVVPSGYNGTYTATVIANGKFTYALASNPGAATGNGLCTVPWQYRTGTRTITLQNGQTLSATFAAGNETVNFGTSVSSNCTSNYFYLHQTTGFSDRSQVGDVSYAIGKGWPLEICCELANTLGCSPWICLPVTWSASDWNSAAGIIQSTLNANLLAYIEGGNEVWNGGYAIRHLAGDVAPTAVGAGAGYNEWYGMQVALMADQFTTVFGNPGFDNRISVQMAGQAADTTVITGALSTPHWASTPPWQRISASGKKTIKGGAIAPYFGEGSFSSADFTHLQAQGDGGYSDFFAQLTANPINGYSYSEGGGGLLPAGGWFGLLTTWVQNHVTALASYGALKISFYECGYQFNSVSQNGQQAFLQTACRDSRMQSVFYTFFNEMVSAGCNGVLTLFNFCDGYITNEQNGTIESVMQPQSPGPPRWQGAVQWGSGQ